MVIHGSIMMGPACPKSDVNMRRSENWKGDKRAVAIMRSIMRKDRFAMVDVVVRGVFRVAKDQGCFGQNCLPFELEEKELLCATEFKPETAPSK